MQKSFLLSLWIHIQTDSYTNSYYKSLKRKSANISQLQCTYSTVQFGNVVEDNIISARERKWDSSHSQRCYRNGLLLYSLLCLTEKVKGLCSYHNTKKKKAYYILLSFRRENLQIFHFICVDLSRQNRLNIYIDLERWQVLIHVTYVRNAIDSIFSHVSTVLNKQTLLW